MALHPSLVNRTSDHSSNFVSSPIDHPTVVVTCDEDLESAARALARRLNLPYRGTSAGPGRYLLRVGANRTELLIAGEEGIRTLAVDFLSGPVRHRLRRFSRREPLVRAVGVRSGATLSVLDATPGLGRDGVLLALMGCKVTMVERSAPLVALLEDGVLRAHRELSQWAGRPICVRIEFGDSRSWMEALHFGDAPQVIYLDPMFPPRSKSALVKLEMRTVREIAGEGDNDGLLEAAFRAARQRVVVKRPKGAAPLCGSCPDHQVKSPTIRYDVYLTGRRPPS